MSFSSNPTPDTFIRNSDIIAGETAVHVGAPHDKLNSHSPHQTAKSPK